MKCTRIITLLAALFLLITCFGCSSKPTPSDTPEETDTEEVVKYVYKTEYIDVDFIKKEDKDAWREPLIKLLSNAMTFTYDRENGQEGYTCPYPDQPAIEKGYDAALFDINIDGVPELLINAGGGSAGNTYLIVYDLLTGEEYGSMDGGHDNSWCIYLNSETGAYETVGQFEWRDGWTGKIRFVNKAEITQTMGSGVILYETPWMTAYYEINATITVIPEDEKNADYDFISEEIYPGVKFYVNDSKACIEDYFAEQDRFTENYIRIAETGIRLFSWYDITDDEDDNVTSAEKMADALLSSDQQFIVPLQ